MPCLHSVCKSLKDLTLNFNKGWNLLCPVLKKIAVWFFVDMCVYGSGGGGGGGML